MLTAKTETSTMFVKPGYWMVLSYWDNLERWELYCNKEPIFTGEYKPTGKALNMHECNIIAGDR